MTDYVKILSRAVADKASYEERRSVYERARQALVAQLRDLDPPLSESDITKQRLSLETAIRDVETQASSGKPVGEMTAPPVATPLEPRASETGGFAVENAVSAEALSGANDLQASIPSAEKTAPSIPAFSPATSPGVAKAPASAPVLTKGDPALVRVSTYPGAQQSAFRRPSKLTMIIAIVALVALCGTLAAWFMVRGDVSSQRDAAAPKVSDRVAQDESLAGKNAAVAQTAYLAEENVEAPKGIENFRGNVTWRIDTQANPQGEGPEKVIRGLVDVPERNLKLLLTLRRNTDAALQASHTIELQFDVSSTFVHGAVDSIAGIKMKPSEQAPGLPLASVAARVVPGYFLVGLSVGAEDTNTVLIRDRPWMDILLIYRNGRRAVLTMEKGIAGENVFNEAFKSWGAKPQE